MAAKVDYDALRAQTMGAADGEAVTVNTRALIDKVLARYSGEWTTLRELLQNAADASASKVVIKFQTNPSATVPVPQSPDSSVRLKHVLLHHTLKDLVVENNGESFRDQDWARLKKIAEGNPDETKIGAFGVGFYSVFAECEEPFVSSGNEALAFYWKGDSLFTKKLELPSSQSTNTTFVLPMRNTNVPVPQLLSLCQFLSSSLTFVGLESIELWLDDWNLLKLHKVNAPSMDLNLPKNIDRKTREGMMQITRVTKEAGQLDATWLRAVEWKPKAISGGTAGNKAGPSTKGAQSTQSLRSFFSKLAPGTNSAAVEKAARIEVILQDQISENLTEKVTATVFIHLNRASLRTMVTPNFSSELERATKKPPPKTTTVSLLSTSYDESTASDSSQAEGKAGAKDIFSSFLPTKGRIFIGFPTNQTTGINAHISTPSVIPTVEREAIDLNNRFIRTWNVELLRVAGIVTRICWGEEMAALQERLLNIGRVAGRKSIVKADIHDLIPEAAYLHNSFTFGESTPASEVGSLVEEAFWTCNRQLSIDVLSSRGVLPSSQVRLASEDLGFIESIPVLPDALSSLGLVQKLRDYGILTEVTFSDIKSELEGKALTSKQLESFLTWMVGKARRKEIDGQMIYSLLDVAVANDSDEGVGKVLVLGEMKNFINPSRISPELPIPPSTMPFKFTKSIAKSDLESLGWEDLEMVSWLRWLVENSDGRGGLTSEHDLTKSPSFAKAVLPIISKQWEGLSTASKTQVVSLMAARTVMPTKLGMKKPSDAYFPNVKLFDDLPIVDLQSVKEKMLIAFGVRKTIEIGVVFERLMSSPGVETGHEKGAQGKWSHVDLIKYLTSVRGDIPSGDILRLRTTKICPAESAAGKATEERFLIPDLFEPNEALRRLKLPLMQWPGPYNPASAEGKFLRDLGLRDAPTSSELIHIMSSAGFSDNHLREHALRYYIDNHHIKAYGNFDHANVKTPYLPLATSNDRLGIPANCFTNERAMALGFDILRKDLHVHANKFGVKPDPPIAECVDRLISKPPQSKKNARDLFSYFASRITDINQALTGKLGGSPIVPVSSQSARARGISNEKEERIRLVPPRMCFLGQGERYADIFDFVDFGQDANSFLLRVGSKHEPNISELAQMTVREPARVFTVLELDKYLGLLRDLAAAWQTLKKDKTLVKEMKTAKFLLASREMPSMKPKTQQEEDEDDSYIKTWELGRAADTVVVTNNDVISFDLFKASLLAAPMEDALEDFYLNLGAPQLGSLVKEKRKLGQVASNQSAAQKLQKLILERSRIFLHDVPKENIRHDPKWLEKNLNIVAVQSISLRIQLEGTNLKHERATSAVIDQDERRGWLLYVTGRAFDYFEVSQALVPLIMNKPKPQMVVILEFLLVTDLLKLRARGYNVNRILRQKQQEARIAEDTRQKLLLQEQEEMKQRELEWNKNQADLASRQQQGALMPGDFPDSPDRDRQRDTPVPGAELFGTNGGTRDIFSRIGKRLGWDNQQRPSSQNRDRGANGDTADSPFDAPPPYSPEDATKARPPKGPETVTAPHHLQQNLVQAIQASRSHNSSSVISQPAINQVKETASYCDSRPAQDISYIGETSPSPGIRIFLSNSLLRSTDSATAQFMAANASALSLFASILVDCANCFALARNTIHIFYDDRGGTIAFNQNKALFFNYRYFENLHLPAVMQGNKAEAVVYWCVVLAHELAHNLVEDHSAQHSYYAESLVIQYFPKIMAKISSLSTPQTAQAGQSPSLLD